MSTLPIYHLSHDDDQSAPAPPVDPLQLLSVADVATLLGVCQRTVWSMAARGELPSPLAIGPKLRRWRRAALEQWLQEREGVA
ncbi:MAG: helix-turn-helix transcriptional regulator [Pirellulales bacterium]